MITADRLDGVLRDRWPTVAPTEPVPQRLAYLLLTKGREEGNKLVLLVFPDGRCTPRLVVKLGRTVTQNAALAAEEAALAALAGRGEHGVVGTPAALGSARLDGRLLILQSVVEGRSLWEVAAASRSTQYVAPIVNWLSHLARATCRPPTAEPAPDRRLVGPESALVGGPPRSAACEAVPTPAAILQGLRRQPIPMVFEQRDMGTWNIVIGADGRITVLDWESACLEGLPAWDLFYFLVHYGFMVHGAAGPDDQLRSFSETFGSITGFGAIAREAVRRYVDAVGLEREWLSPLMAACWAHHAHAEAARRRTQAADTLFGRLVEATLRLDREGRLGWPRAA